MFKMMMPRIDEVKSRLCKSPPIYTAETVNRPFDCADERPGELSFSLVESQRWGLRTRITGKPVTRKHGAGALLSSLVEGEGLV